MPLEHGPQRVDRHGGLGEVRRLLGEVDGGQLVEAHQVVGEDVGGRAPRRSAAGPRPSRPSSPAASACCSGRQRVDVEVVAGSRPAAPDGALVGVRLAQGRGGTSCSPPGVHKLTGTVLRVVGLLYPTCPTIRAESGAAPGSPHRDHSAPPVHAAIGAPCARSIDANRPRPVARSAGGCRLSDARPLRFSARILRTGSGRDQSTTEGCALEQ